MITTEQASELMDCIMRAARTQTERAGLIDSKGVCRDPYMFRHLERQLSDEHKRLAVVFARMIEAAKGATNV